MDQDELQEQYENTRGSQGLASYLEGTKQNLRVYKWLFNEVVTPKSKKYLKRMLWCIVAMIVLQTIQPAALSRVFDGTNTHSSIMVIQGLVVWFATLFLAKVAQWGQDRNRERVMGMHQHQLEDRLTLSFFGKSLAQHVEEGGLLSTTNIETGKHKSIQIERTLYFEAFQVLLQLALSMICLFFLNFIAGVVMALVILIYLGWSVLINNKIAREYTSIDQGFRRLSRRRRERFDRVERVKVCGKEESETTEMSRMFGELNQKSCNFWLEIINICFGRSTVNLIGIGCLVAWGAWLAFHGELSIGFLYPLYSWVTRVGENIWRLSDVEHTINWNIPSVVSMIDAVSISPAIVDKPDAHVLDHTKPHRISFEDVSHHYPVGKKGEDEEVCPALSRISFAIELGEKVALLGPSGSGKSTIMKKLLRFGNPTSGRIMINGYNLCDITRQSWLAGIGYIPQSSQIIGGTLGYNLKFGLTDEQRESISDDELWELMRLLKIDFGKRLKPKGLDTYVGRNGIQLSGGQAQRLMIGAAVIKNPWLLVVDEATSSLDATTEKEVQQGLDIALQGANTSALIVAHRLATVRRNCTKFVVLKNADEVGEGESQVEAIAGSFEELYEMSPTFRRLADDQEVKMETCAA